MHNRIYISLSLVIILLGSCEQVIDVDLNDVEKKYVIEAVLSDQANSCKVLISQSKNFDEDNNFIGITGAQVTIADGNGPEQTLTASAPGVYENSGITGVVGHTYRLKVTVSGQVFTASSTIPSKVLFDTLYISDELIFDEVIKLSTLEYQDPPGRGNNYRFIQYINGEKDKTIFIRDDDLNDGKRIDAKLFARNDDDDDDESGSKIKKGDLVKVEMLCVDEPINKYWYSLDQSALGTNESASPANPVTNIKGGALGYFSAHTYQAQIITAP